MEFRLMGGMQLLVDEEPVQLPGAAERGLLALLLLSAGRSVAASSLVDRLWSERALPTDPLNALQLRVSKLRRALAEHGLDVVRRDGTGYRADVAPDSVDLHRFVSRVHAARAAVGQPGEQQAALASYDEALALWRGDPLADFAGEGWATVESARLQQLRLAAITERAELALVLGRHVEVAADLEPLVAADPRHEALTALLMTALYRSGRQAEALDAFARTRDELAEQLGLEPSAALRALHQRVLQQDEELAGPPGPLRPAAVPAVTVPAEPARPSVPAVPRPRLIGRDEEIEAVAEVVQRERVVTLVGPGGAGKTSLALAAAHVAGAAFDHDVVLCRLAQVSDQDGVPLALADALGVPLDGADPSAGVRDRLLAFLSRRRMLLLLDNCEHVVDAAARLVDSIANGAPDVTVLATSREVLAVAGEVQMTVGPLAVAPEGADLEQVLQSPAAQLFVARARAVRSGWHPELTDAHALVRICGQLDGMPLALELAAARVASLSLQDLADRLTDRFGLLTTGPRTAEVRQRTLRATVEWSHDLLDDSEQVAFRRLAVFHGGWALPAAEAVLGDDPLGTGRALDVLTHLVNRSMVVCDPGHPTRYRMLETLRQYAAERLDASGEREAVAGRHATFFRDLGEQAESALRGGGQREALRLLRAEQPNIRAALSWLAEHPGRCEDGLVLAGSLGLFWHLGRHLEGRDVLGRLIAVPGGSDHARARALQAVSIVERPRACLVHPSPRCGQTARESLELFQRVGDRHRAALSQVLLAVEDVAGTAPDRFEALLAEAEREFAQEHDRWGHAVVAFVRLQNYLLRGQQEQARAMGRTAADGFRALDDPWGLSAVLFHLGWGLKEFGHYAESVPVLEEAIRVSAEAGLFNTTQWALSDLGLALLYLGERGQAADAFGRAETASEEIGDAAGQILARHGRGVMARISDDPAAARAEFQAAFTGLRALGTPLFAGFSLAGAAWCDLREGRPDASRDALLQVQQVAQGISDAALTATAWEGLAHLDAAAGDVATARELLTEAARLRRLVARPAPPHEQRDLERLEASLSS